MTRRSRRIAAAGVALAALVTLVVLLRGARASGPPPRAGRSPAATRDAARSARARVAPPAALAGSAGDGDATTPQIEGTVFADGYATDLCACKDLACAAEVNDRYSQQLGAVRPERDARKLHASFARAMACQHALETAP